MNERSSSEDLKQAFDVFLRALNARTSEDLRLYFDSLVPLLHGRLTEMAKAAQRRNGHETSCPSEVAQNVWFRLFSRLISALSSTAAGLREPPDERALLGLLHRIVDNDIRSRKRRRARLREASSSSLYDSYNPLTDSRLDPVSQADREDQKALLWLAIQDLLPDDQFIAVERMIERKRWKDIGTAIGASEDATRMRWDRIKNELALRMCAIRHVGPWVPKTAASSA